MGSVGEIDSAGPNGEVGLVNRQNGRRRDASQKLQENLDGKGE